jgi:hypothetical protein
VGDALPSAFPTETEIYLLPDGRVVVADLPAELVALVAALGPAEPCAVPPPDDIAAAGELPAREAAP